MTRRSRSFFALALCAVLITCAAPSQAARAANGLSVPRGRATGAATVSWIQAQWIGRCFPEFTRSIVPPDERDTMPIPQVRDAGVGTFSLGSWDDPEALLPGFLIQSLLTAQQSPSGYALLEAYGYDAAQKTLVFSTTTPRERFAGYVTGMAGGPPNLPALDASLATNAGLPGIALPVSAVPPAPAYAALSRRFGRYPGVRRACDLTEVRYESPDPMALPHAAEYHYIVAIYDSSGQPRAFGAGRITP